jgi:hypothetical protein
MSLNPYTAVCISMVLLCIPKLQIVLPHSCSHRLDEGYKKKTCRGN